MINATLPEDVAAGKNIDKLVDCDLTAENSTNGELVVYLVDRTESV